jgi:hypothetical protein
VSTPTNPRFLSINADTLKNNSNKYLKWSLGKVSDCACFADCLENKVIVEHETNYQSCVYPDDTLLSITSRIIDIFDFRRKNKVCFVTIMIENMSD